MTVRARFQGVRIALVAKFNSRYHRTGLSLAKALEELGAEVAPVEVRTKGVNALFGRDLVRRLTGSARSADLVLSYNAVELVPAMIGEARRHSRALWVNWFPDPPSSLEQSLSIGAAYDWCFLFDSSMVDRHRALGRRADFLPLGFDPDFYRPRPPVDPQAPMVFVGSKEPLRDGLLASLGDLGLEIYGPGQPRGPLFGEALLRTYARAQIGLNVHQFFGEPLGAGRYGTGANQRVFELAGLGIPQLVDAKQDLALCFEPDREVATFRSVDECRSTALALLADPTRRSDLGQRAHRRALAQHTWRHRLSELLDRVLR